jgi:hypothetical protein
MDPRVINPYVQNILVEALVRRRWGDLERTFPQFTAIPESSTAAGWLWEEYCHTVLPTMAAFDVKDLVTGKTLRVSNMPSQTIRF